jgi:hypothetical protein
MNDIGASTLAKPRSLAEQNLAELGEGSVLARQKADHVELDRLLHRLGEVQPAEQDGVLLDIYRLVFPHAFAEEAVLWPVMRRALVDGEKLTLKVEREHQEINELVTRLEGLAPEAPERQEVLDRMVALLRQDVRDEEDELLPRLQAVLSPGHLHRLGLAWELVRQIAPTRAHAIVSRRPPGNVVAALPLALLDRARDLVDGTSPQRRPAGAPLARLGSALAQASRAIERLPVMRRGEDPSTRADQEPAASSAVPWGMLALAGLVAPLVFAATRRHR